MNPIDPFMTFVKCEQDLRHRIIPPGMWDVLKETAAKHPCISILQRIDLLADIKVEPERGWRAEISYLVFTPNLAANTCTTQHFHETVRFTPAFEEERWSAKESQHSPKEQALYKARAEWDELVTRHGWWVFHKNAVGMVTNWKVTRWNSQIPSNPLTV